MFGLSRSMYLSPSVTASYLVVVPKTGTTFIQGNSATRNVSMRTDSYGRRMNFAVRWDRPPAVPAYAIVSVEDSTPKFERVRAGIQTLHLYIQCSLVTLQSSSR